MTLETYTQMHFRRQIVIVCLLIAFGWLLAMPVSAFNCTSGTNNFLSQFTITLSNGTQINTVQGLPQLCTPQQALGNVIQLLLEFSALVAVVFIILGGFWYLTSAGNEEQSEKGRKAMTSAIIGLVVIVMAFALVRITVNLLTSGLTGGPTGSGTTPAVTTTNNGNNNPTVTQPTVDPNSIYASLGPSDVYDNKEHLAATMNQTFNNNNSGMSGVTAQSDIAPTNTQAILQLQTACQAKNILLPEMDIKLGYADSSTMPYGTATYQKLSSGSWEARVNSADSTGNATTLQFWVCGYQSRIVPIPGHGG